jgi:lysophospholipase L1-like esterase
LWLLRLVTALTPFALLAIAEGGLRVAGFGHELEPLFIPSPDQPDFKQANPRAVLRFFADAAAAPSVAIETGYFRATRPPHALRLVVQGESSAAGFPYGFGASLAGMLDARLERAYPEREIEVISTAMAAVNSYALLDFAPEILAERPDAVLVYVGHNEFLGILGVGSTLRVAGSPLLTRLFLATRELRLGQLLQRALPSTPPAGSSQTPGTLMERVARERSIPLDSSLYRRGVAQFERNLEALLATYERARVPVFIGTLASNERDQPPFAGAAARHAYARARDLDSRGAAQAARAAYRDARDLDELRFRAPEVFNEIIRRSATKYGATVVDVQARLAASGPIGVVGQEAMLEHVHPNLEGYWLLADEFLKALLASGLTGASGIAQSDEEARRAIPLTEVDRHLAEYKLLRIRSAWPFRAVSVEPRLPPPVNEAERLAQALYRGELDWLNAQFLLRQNARSMGDEAQYAHISWILADAFPFLGSLQFDAGTALIAAGHPREARRYTARAVELAPDTVNFLLADAHALALSGRPAEARARLERVLELEPHNATARTVLAQLSTPKSR